MSSENNKKKNFFQSLKAAFMKVARRKYRQDLRKVWDVVKHTVRDIVEKPLRETGLLLTAIFVPGAGIAWVAYRLMRFKNRDAANDNTPAAEMTPEQKVEFEKKLAEKTAESKENDQPEKTPEPENDLRQKASGHKGPSLTPP